MRAAATSTLLLLLGSLCLASGGPPVETLIRRLGHHDPVVREEAGRAILARGLPVVAQLMDAADAKDPLRAREAEKLRRILLLGHRVKEADRAGAPFWMLLEELRDLAPGRLRDAALRLALGGAKEIAEVSARRDRAIEAVTVFCRDWNEFYTRGGVQEKRYDALVKDLRECGAPAVPHLMRVLDVHATKAFFNLDETCGVTARMQVRAIFGLSFLEPREAVPYLLVHAHSMSFTAASNAGAGFRKLTGGGLTPPLAKPDRKAIVAWWAEHRSEFPHGSRWVARALLAALHRDAAAELVGAGGPFWIPETVEVLPGALTRVRTDTARLAGLLLGEKMDYEPDAAPDKRLDQIRAIEQQLEADLFK